MTHICCAQSSDFHEGSDCDFPLANFICKHSCVLLFSAQISLMCTHFKKSTAMRKSACHGFAWKRSVTHAILGWFQLTMV